MKAEGGGVVIGLIGGICAGKSTISKILEENGAYVIDADKLGHLAYAKDTECFQALVNHFGSVIVDAGTGEVDRKALGGIVFSDPNEMQNLNRIVWPAIRALLEDRIQQVRGSDDCPPVIVVEAAVMLEAGWTDLADEVWAVEVDRDVSVSRLMKRNNLSEEQAQKRIEAQPSNDVRRKAATRVFENNMTTEEGSKLALEPDILDALSSLTRKNPKK